MLTIFPSSSESYSKKILKKFQDKEKNLEILVAKENDIILGYIVFCIDGYKIYILDICYIKEHLKNTKEADELVDSMIRSVLSFALNRRIFVIYSKNKSLFPLLNKFGFSQNNGEMFINLSKILGKCKKCKASKSM